MVVVGGCIGLVPGDGEEGGGGVYGAADGVTCVYVVFWSALWGPGLPLRFEVCAAIDNCIN